MHILFNSKCFLLKLLMISSTGFICQSIKAQSEETKTKDSFTIENCINSFSYDKTDKTRVGYQFWFVDKNFVDGRTIKLSVVQPNQATHEPHSHENDEFFNILEGSAKFYLNGENKVVGPNTTLYCPPKSTHGISNVGDTELKYLVLKKYDVNQK